MNTPINEAVELAPCPFCGGTATIGPTSTMWMIECNNSGCSANPDVFKVFKHEAISAWNRRAALPPPIVEPVTEAQAMADQDQVPHMIVFDDADQQARTVIGTTRARFCFQQISGSWNAHLFAKIASNSRDCKYPNYTTPASAPSDGAADARDAARYQWLREHWFLFGTMHSITTTLGFNLHRVNAAGDIETLDVAIDAAIASTHTTTGGENDS